MKTLLIAVTSKFIHASLAPWYLKSYCGGDCGEITVREYTVNNEIGSVFADIASQWPDVAAFSCYVWNISFVLRLAQRLKLINPATYVILGGPEASMTADKLLAAHPAIDAIVCGEGEMPFKQLLLRLQAGKSADGITGVMTGTASGRSYFIMPDLDAIPSPYSDEMLERSGDRSLFMYESSRGCPFSCAYCTSAVTRGVRNFSLDRVEADLNRIVAAGFKQIKFADRTFNADKRRAAEILRLIAGLDTDACFHFEVAADLFDDGMISLLASMPAGRVQIEAGIQTINDATLSEVDRVQDPQKLTENIRRMIMARNIHVHLDLIAGLPYESIEDVRRSFNAVYLMKPDQLQLGFLKILPGTPIAERSGEYGYIFPDEPPYEILASDSLSPSDIFELKSVAALIDDFYNTQRFTETLEFLTALYPQPYDFFLALSIFSKSGATLNTGRSMKENYKLLYDFCVRHHAYIAENELRQRLSTDFLQSDSSGRLPDFLWTPTPKSFHDKCFEFLKSGKMINEYLPGFAGKPSKEIAKHVHFEMFEPAREVYLFDYSHKDKVTGRYRMIKVPGEDLI